MKAIQLVSKDTSNATLISFLHTHAQQCYFLEEIDEAFANLPHFLEQYSSKTSFYMVAARSMEKMRMIWLSTHVRDANQYFGI